MWSQTSHELLYLSPARDQIMSARYTVKGDTFDAEKPEVWLSKLTPGTGMDLAPDGKRIVVFTPVQTGKPEPPKPEHEVVFIFNFVDQLRRRVPLGK